MASAVVPLFVFSLALAIWEASATRRAVETGLAETARALSVALERELGASTSALQALAASSAIDGDAAALERQARAVAGIHRGWIAMIDRDGRQLLNTRAAPGEPLPPARGLAHVRQVFESGASAVSDLFVGALADEPLIAVHVPVRRGGEVRYALSLALPPGQVAALLAEQRLPATWLGMVTDGSGRIIARAHAHERYVGRPAPDWFREALGAGGESGLAGGGSLEGTSVRSAYQRVPGSRWAVAVAVPEHELASAWRRPLLALGAGGLLVAALGVALSLVYARRITALVERQVLAQAEAQARRREAEAAAAAAEAASRSKDHFLATLSHELRTPVAAIVGWIAVLRARRGDAQKTEQALAVIERNALQQTRLIDDLLDVSRIVAGKLRLERKPTDLSAAIGEALDGVRPLARDKRIALEARIEPAIAVHGDHSRLVQVAANLLVNAVKFTPEDGRIEVTLARHGSDARLVVRDNGRGIEPHEMAHLFDRFSQAEAHAGGYQPGLGLGLAIVQRLAGLHGGSVRAESEGRGRGATFTVRLPALAAAQAAVPRAAASGERSDLSGVRVLVVDDHEDGRRWVSELLGARGAQTGEASYAGEALAAEERLRPDVIVSDIAMARGDGYELIRGLRGRGRRTPAIALTALAAGEERERALREGFDAVLAKGSEPEAIVAAVARCAGSSIRENELKSQ